jgi:hypothetical protein
MATIFDLKNCLLHYFSKTIFFDLPLTGHTSLAEAIYQLVGEKQGYRCLLYREHWLMIRDLLNVS